MRYINRRGISLLATLTGVALDRYRDQKVGLWALNCSDPSN